MKKKIFALAAFLAVINNVSASEAGSVYFGLEGQTHLMGFEEGEFSSFSSKPHNVISPYIGFMVNKSFAIESGVSSATCHDSSGEFDRVRNRHRVHARAMGLALPIEPLSARIIIKTRNSHISVLRIFPVSDGHPLELFGSIGVSHITGTSQMKIICVNGTSKQGEKNRFNKAFLMATVGAQYAFTESVSARFRVGYMNTSKLKLPIDDGVAGVCPTFIKPTDTTYFGVGLFSKF